MSEPQGSLKVRRGEYKVIPILVSTYASWVLAPSTPASWTMMDISSVTLIFTCKTKIADGTSGILLQKTITPAMHTDPTHGQSEIILTETDTMVFPFSTRDEQYPYDIWYSYDTDKRAGSSVGTLVVLTAVNTDF